MQTTLRLEPELLERADTMADALGRVMAGMEFTRAAVLRTAILRGLEVMERELGVKTRKKR